MENVESEDEKLTWLNSKEGKIGILKICRGESTCYRVKFSWSCLRTNGGYPKADVLGRAGGGYIRGAWGNALPLEVIITLLWKAYFHTVHSVWLCKNEQQKLWRNHFTVHTSEPVNVNQSLNFLFLFLFISSLSKTHSLHSLFSQKNKNKNYAGNSKPSRFLTTLSRSSTLQGSFFMHRFLLWLQFCLFFIYLLQRLIYVFVSFSFISRFQLLHEPSLFKINNLSSCPRFSCNNNWNIVG